MSCMAESKENYYRDLGSKRVKHTHILMIKIISVMFLIVNN